jgi:hypothetical protein
MYGHFHQKLIFGLPVTLTPDEKARHIDRVLTAFFKMYGRPEADPALGS